MANVMVKAKKRGTITHAKGNFHFDPDGFPSARKRSVPQDVAAAAYAKGLVDILRTRVIEEDGDTSVDYRAATRIDANSARLTGQQGAMADVLGARGPGDTFATTHTERDRTATANVGGAVIEDIGEGDDDDDEEAEDTDLGDGVDTTSSDRDAPPAGDAAELGSSRARRAARKSGAAVE